MKNQNFKPVEIDMGFKDNLKKLKEVASAAKDKAVNFVSEVCAVTREGPWRASDTMVLLKGA
ncbi:MAG: hypothetical protein AB7V04_01715 [Desulfomonilaceae bacterium]